MATIKGKGTVLKVTISASLTAIPQITSLTPGGVTNDKVDTTNLDSVWMESDSTIPDGTPISGQLNLDMADTEHRALHALAVAGTSAACEVLPPTGGYKFTFTAFFTQFNFDSVDVKGIHKVSFTLQPVGAVTIASV